MTIIKHSILIFILFLSVGVVSASNDFNEIKRTLDNDKQKILNENLNKFDFEIVEMFDKGKVKKNKRGNLNLNNYEGDNLISILVYPNQGFSKEEIIQSYFNLIDVRNYDFGLHFSAKVSEETFYILLEDERINNIQPNVKAKSSMQESISLMDLDDVFNLGYSGDDVRVCVIDSGSNMLGIVDGICICTEEDNGAGGCCVNNQATDTIFTDDLNHGTFVTNILANSAGQGTAPNVDLFVVDVMDDEGDMNFDDIGLAVDWCRNQNVDIITMSLGRTNLVSSTCKTYIDTQIDNAIQNNIAVFAASGNDGYERIDYPACNSQVMGIGATYDWGDGTEEIDWADVDSVSSNCNDYPTLDGVACWSNKGEELDLMAPGSVISSGGFTSNGTSMSTPIAAGVAALLLEKDPSKSPSEIKQILTSTGKQVYDSDSNRWYPRVDALAAINSICTCIDWEQQTCGYSICEDYEMGYTRNCDGDTCGGELDCRDDSSCSGSAPSGVDFCDFDDLSCDKFYTESGSTYCDESDDDYYRCSLECIADTGSCGTYGSWQYLSSFTNVDEGDDEGWISGPSLTLDEDKCYNLYGKTDLSVSDWDPGGIWYQDSESVDVYSLTTFDEASYCSGEQYSVLNVDTDIDNFGQGNGGDYDMFSKFIGYKDINCGGNVAHGLTGGLTSYLYYQEADYERETYYENCEVPYTETISLDSTIKTNQDVDCYVEVETSGDNSDPDRIKMKWYINGDYYDSFDCDDSGDDECDDDSGSTWSHTFTLDSSLYSKGDTIQCEARGYGDDGGHGAYHSSSVVTVSNTAPTLNSMSLSDGIVLINDSLTVSFSSSDIDYDDVNLKCCEGINCDASTGSFCTSNNNYCVVLIDDSYSVGEHYVTCSVYDGDDYSGSLTRDFLVNVGEFETNLNYPTEGESFYKRYIEVLFSEAVNRIGEVVTYVLEYSSDGGNNWTEVVGDYGVEDGFSNGTTEEFLNVIENTTETVYVRIPKNAKVNNFEFEVEGL